MSQPCPAHEPAPWSLASATGSGFATALLAHTAELLLDQAHLEKKAAAAAVQTMFRVERQAAPQQALSRLAREELLHFERALRLLAARGLAFGPLQPSPYAERLKAACRRPHSERQLDELLVAALIEARSSERMQALATGFAGCDAELAAFYDDLVQAEARHHEVYVEIAIAQAGTGAVVRRWQQLAAHEAAVLAALPWAPRLHGGLGNVDG